MSVLPERPPAANLATRLLHEVTLARREIREGRFQRTMAIMAAFAAIASGFEAYTQHLRGAFNHWLMWTPVWLTPPAVLAAAAALLSERLARMLLPALSLMTLLDGVVGFVFHLRGIRRLPGGFQIGQYNLVIGPPIFAPLLMCSVGTMGLLAGILQPERLRPPGSEPPNLSTVKRSNVQRGIALAAAFFAVLAGGEAYFEHLRGSFNQRVMWAPVWVTLPMVVAGIGAALGKPVTRRALPVVSAVTLGVGLLGFALHLRGIRDMPGGFANFQFNITLGPPLFAPLLFTSVGLLGLLAALVGRKGG